MQETMNEFASRVFSYLPTDKRKEVQVFPHARVDGDCVGTAVALVSALRKLGYSARVMRVIQRSDNRFVFVDIGRAEATLPRQEQVKDEDYSFNKRMKFLILRVETQKERPVIIVSRSHPNLVKKLLEKEVPEIHDGIVEIVSVAREAGSRSKVAVISRDPDVDPLGACVGQRGARIQAIMDELASLRRRSF